ncbi:MAG: hypothetical protein QM569_13795 [Acidovorax sp.]|uniref:hypothetical protein n=1 Tax=Acidovorax sp. TaxID=1872122 RepID=UPI0039E61440
MLPLKYGKSLPAAARDAIGSVPVFGSSGVVGQHSTALTSGPTIVVGRKGNVGAVHFSAVPCWPIDTAYYVEPPAGHSATYYRYLLTSLNLVRLDKSTAIPGLSRDDYNAIEVAVHPPAEQLEIVAELEKQFSRLDEAVASLQRVKANLKRYKASVLKAAVEGRLVVPEATLARREGRSYETGKQLLQRMLDVRNVMTKGKRVAVNQADHHGLPECPDGWVWTTCDAALNGIDAGASFKCEERPPLGDEIGVLKVSALTWGTYDEAESKTCKDASRVEKKFLVRNGDFLFSRANTIEFVGACVIVGKTTKQLMLSDKTLRFEIFPQVLPEWLLVCLRCKFGRNEIERLATGNQESMRNIGQERIRQIRMPLPPLVEQTRIVAEVDRLLSIVREVESEVDTNLQRAQALRQSILQRAFSVGDI